jgi:predicted DNA-binding ribbon-helix-helix protein
MMIDEPKTAVFEAKLLRAGVVKRSLVIAGHRTSISLEQAFWNALRALAERRSQSINALVAEIDAEREGANLSSAIRVFLFQIANRQ